MFNTIIMYTLAAQEAEQILKYAESALRCDCNLYGFKRLGSGYETIMAEGFGNPYGVEEELKLFGIAIAVPEGMTHRTVMAYLSYGNRRVNCYAMYNYMNI